MFIDTHCHVNILAKSAFDVPLTQSDLANAGIIIEQATAHNVSPLINVGTSVTESQNCIDIARAFPHNYAVIGIHPNDLTSNWKHDITRLKKMLEHTAENKIVGIGECGFDFHYPGYNKSQQYNAFKAQIELALEHNLALVIHSRDAYDETLSMLEEYQHDITRSVVHCFSYDQEFAKQVITWHHVLGIGGTVTYPRNHELRAVVDVAPLEKIVLETDAPFLPPQVIRGKKNHPQYIVAIAEFIATLKEVPLETVAQKTTTAALTLFGIQGTS